MLSAADAAAMARHAQRVRAATPAGREAGEDAAALFDAVIAIVEGACGSSCPLPLERASRACVGGAQRRPSSASSGAGRWSIRTGL